MDLVLTVVNLTTLVFVFISMMRLERILKRQREALDRIESIKQLVIEGRARQSQIATVIGRAPHIDRAKQAGPRHPGTRGAKQAEGMRFVRKGGEEDELGTYTDDD